MNATTTLTEQQLAEKLAFAYAKRTTDLAVSLSLTVEVLEISKGLNNNQLIGNALSQYSFLKMIKGDFKESLELANQSITYFEKTKDELGVGDALFNIASVYYKTDNSHLGLKYLLDSVKIYKKHNQHAKLSRSYKSIATIYEFFNDEAKAIQAYEDGIAAAKIVGDKNLISNIYNPLSGIYLKQGNIKLATEFIEKSIAKKTETGDIRGLGFAYYGMGKIYTETKQYDLAEVEFKKALAIHRETNETVGISFNLYKLSNLYFVQNRIDEALDYCQQTIEHTEKYSIVMILVKCYYLICQILIKKNDLHRAIHYFEKHLQQKDSLYYSQTQQFVNSYDMLLKMEQDILQEKYAIEKAEIIEKKDRAEYAMQAKQEFLSNMSHEIRTPLNAVITISSLLKERSDSEDKELLESLQFASNNLLNIVNDILDFSKLEDGKAVLEAKPSNIRKFLQQIIGTYAGLAKEKGLGLELNVANDIAENYEMDETKLSQILGNLIHNAIKFTEKGSVTLQLTKQDKKILFEVIDTGIGIPDSFMNELFESFTQPKFVTTKKNKGSGLGLAIVKKLVALHKGAIQVSTSNKGTNFYFSIPLTEVKTANENVNAPKVLLPDMNVLVVDDNQINVLVASKLIKKWGIEVDTALSGNAAIQMATTNNYDIILMDIHMPEMDGYEAATKIRTLSNHYQQIPIYTLTADVTVTLNEAQKKVFNGFLRKPIERDELYAVLQQASA
jgi:signal transduction histidine kinase